MQIETRQSAPPEWDGYVERHAYGSAYHRAAAVSVGKLAFGLRTTYLTAHGSGGQLAGVLPLVEQSSLIFGRFLVSVPFFTYGGILADDAEVAAALARHAAAVAHERRAAHVELRHSAPVPSLGFPERLDKVSMVLRLPDSESALAKQLGSKLRSQIKRAERESPEVLWGGRELLEQFYDVFAPTMHQLGTPVYSRRFFDVTYDALEGLIKVLVLRVRGRAEAAAVIVRHGRRIEVPWAACTAAGKRAALNMRLYFEMLQQAIREGAEAFDFGRSTPDSGTYKFKAQWGAEPLQLHWHYWLPAGAELPRLNHSNPKYALAASLWRKMPLWCANLIGPHIVRNLP